MPVLIAMLIGGLVSAASHIVGRVLLALGLSYVTYRGIDTLMTFLKTGVMTQLGGMGPDIIQLLGVLQVGTCVNIIASAFAARLALAGLTSGALTSFVLGAAKTAI
ncbi:MAG: hypothetical protein JWN73_37 [Betaproteobacteria bacterium]|nr:hypothetical protein [Betaproteobacteria bacterium]